MVRKKNLPMGIEVQEITYGDPKNNLPGFVKEIARTHGYGDSAGPWTMYVHPDDIELAFKEKAQGNGAACVMAQAGQRLGAQSVYFYRHTAWVDFGSGPIVRYYIPNATYRNIIDPFDRNDRDGVLPGMYPLLAPTPGRTLKHMREYNSNHTKKQSKNVDPNRQQQHSERVILAPKV